MEPAVGVASGKRGSFQSSVLTGAEAGLLCMIQQQTCPKWDVRERSDNENPVLLPCGLVSHCLFPLSDFLEVYFFKLKLVIIWPLIFLANVNEIKYKRVRKLCFAARKTLFNQDSGGIWNPRRMWRGCDASLHNPCYPSSNNCLALLKLQIKCKYWMIP